MFRIGHRIARSIHRAISPEDSVDVSEIDGVRSMHLGSDTIQSSMRVKQPFHLELRYTRAMMSFLLFNDHVRDIVVIGLGGGSVPKYIYHHLPDTKTLVVEINPRVIEVARSHFFVPENNARFEVIEGDGVAFINAHPDTCQLLIMDGFGPNGLAPELSSQDFYDQCAEALTTDGILLVNLWGSDRNFDVYLQRIEQSFEGRVLVLPTGRPGNVLIFAFRREPRDMRWTSLRERAKALEAEHRSIEFLEFLEKLRDHNPNTSNRLLLERSSA